MQGDGGGGQWVVAECRHGLQIARDSTVGVCKGYGSEASGDLLLDLGHADIALGPVVGEGSIGASGKAQDVLSVDDETLVEVMGVGPGERSALALFFAAGFGASPSAPARGSHCSIVRCACSGAWTGAVAGAG